MQDTQAVTPRPARRAAPPFPPLASAATPPVAPVPPMAPASQLSIIMPVLSSRADDDLAVVLPPGATKWQRLSADPVARRVSRVVITLLVGVVLLVIVNFAMAPRSMKSMTPEDCRQVRRMNTVLEGIRPLVNMLIILVLLFIILSECGVNLTALFATAGLLGIIIGLGAQAAIKSFIAGIGFVVQDQFSIGDFVALDVTPGPLRVFGVVTAFRTQNTTVQSFDGASHYISNGMISVVTNFSKHAQRAQVDVHIPASCPIPVDTLLKHVERETHVMATAPQLRHKMVLPPVVKGITSNTEGTYTITVAAIAHPRAQYAVEWYIRHQLLRLLQRLQVTGTSVALQHEGQADQDTFAFDQALGIHSGGSASLGASNDAPFADDALWQDRSLASHEVDASAWTLGAQ